MNNHDYGISKKTEHSMLISQLFLKDHNVAYSGKVQIT